MRGNSDPTGGLLVGMGAGVILFYKGFRRFREYKIVADTPRIPIRSMPMGLVHIRGRAMGDQLVPSPLTRTPCCFYKVVVERWKTEDRSGHWEQHFVDRDGIKFFLQDETGQVLIDSYSAEYDLPASAERVVGGSHLSAGAAVSAAPALTTAGPASDIELLQYIERAGGRHYLQSAEHWMEKKGPLQDSGKEQIRQHVMQLMQAGLAFQQGGKLPVDLIRKMIESRGPLPDPEHEAGRQALLEYIRQTKSLPGNLGDLPSGHSIAEGRYRLHEYLILPGQEYFVTGTCVENPESHDASDRNLIEQGGNEKTFLVSARPEQVAEKDIRNTSFKMILGGAGLTLVCLAGLLAHFHMF
jgi:hypothetical protein